MQKTGMPIDCVCLTCLFFVVCHALAKQAFYFFLFYLSVRSEYRVNCITKEKDDKKFLNISYNMSMSYISLGVMGHVTK